VTGIKALSTEHRLDMAIRCFGGNSASYTIQFEITRPEQVHSLFIFWDLKGAAGLLVSLRGRNIVHFIGQVMSENDIHVLALIYCWATTHIEVKHSYHYPE